MKRCQENFIDKAFQPLYNFLCCLGGIKMKWSLLELKKYQETPLVFDETLLLKEDLIKRDKQILELSPVRVKGFVAAGKKEYLLHYQATATITVPSSRSLAPVELPVHFSVDETFMTPEQFQQRDDEIPAEEIFVLEGQTIDLDESVADNLLLAIPIQVLTEEEKNTSDMPSGDDWVVLSEEEYQSQKETQAPKVDPRLAKLSELFHESDSDNV